MITIIKELLLKLVINRVLKGTVRQRNLFNGQMRDAWIENSGQFRKAIKEIDPNFKTLGSYSNYSFKYKKKDFIYLDIYGQEDNWEDWFDVCIVRGNGIFCAVYHKSGVTFYEGQLPKKFAPLLGKRTYYFNPKSKKFIIRSTKEEYLKLKKENQNKVSEDWVSGPHCKIFLKKVGA